jgi:hypothetical protein
MLRKAVSALKAGAALTAPYFETPLDRGLSLLSRQACEARNSGPRFAYSCASVSHIYCKMPGPGHIKGETKMNEVVMMNEAEPRKVLQTAIDNKVTAIMSYLSKGKWHVAKVLPVELSGERLRVESTHADSRQHPINIQIGQPVGMSFKHEYGKYVFDTAVVALEPSTDAGGGTVVLALPEHIEVIQRRSYFRVEAPASLKVHVTLWHRKSSPDSQERMPDGPQDARRYGRGRLIDVSAGGAQVMLEDDESGAEPQFRQGQFIGIRFTPLPYETPLVLTAQIRNALPRADGNTIYLGLQIVGLEASIEGRQMLTRLVGVVERYYKMNQAAAKHKESPSVPAAV